MRQLSHSAELYGPLFHVTHRASALAAMLFHVTQSCEPAQPNFGPMSAKSFHVKRADAVRSAKVDMKPRAMFHVTHGAPAPAAMLFHVTQSCEPAQKRLGLWSEP